MFVFIRNLKIMSMVLLLSSILIADFLTKYWIIKIIPYGESFTVLPFFNIVHAKNLGISFSFFYNHSTFGPWILAFLSLIIICVLYAYIRKITNKYQKLSLIAVMSGALGNVLDRFLYGGVIDFLDFYYDKWHWPAFNIADSAIVIGIFLYILFEKKQIKT